MNFYAESELYPLWLKKRFQNNLRSRKCRLAAHEQLLELSRSPSRTFQARDLGVERFRLDAVAHGIQRIGDLLTCLQPSGRSTGCPNLRLFTANANESAFESC